MLISETWSSNHNMNYNMGRMDWILRQNKSYSYYKWWNGWYQLGHAGLVFLQAFEIALFVQSQAVIQVNFALLKTKRGLKQ